MFKVQTWGQIRTEMLICSELFATLLKEKNDLNKTL